jgi:ribosomal 30S subunit maturation factor RimM
MGAHWPEARGVLLEVESSSNLEALMEKRPFLWVPRSLLRMSESGREFYLHEIEGAEVLAVTEDGAPLSAVRVVGFERPSSQQTLLRLSEVNTGESFLVPSEWIDAAETRRRPRNEHGQFLQIVIPDFWQWKLTKS